MKALTLWFSSKTYISVEIAETKKEINLRLMAEKMKDQYKRDQARMFKEKQEDLMIKSLK